MTTFLIHVTTGPEESILTGYQAEFAMPDVLVRLAAEAYKVLCY